MFFAEAPQPNPARTLIKGVICRVRDKLINELAKGKPMEKILRKKA
jgi:hypothetical protein